MNIFSYSIPPDVFNEWTLRISFILTSVLFVKGMVWVVLALKYTRSIDEARLKSVRRNDFLSDDSFAERIAKTLHSAYREQQLHIERMCVSGSTGSAAEASCTSASKDNNMMGLAPFLHDAARQVGEHIIETKYSSNIRMCSNLLPPIGFWGTVSGMIVIFLLKGNPVSEMNSGALGTALWSSFWALVGYFLLEMAHMWVVNRARKRIDDVLRLPIESS